MRSAPRTRSISRRPVAEVHGLPQGGRGGGAVAPACLPVVSQLGHRSLLALGDEYGVVAEAARPPRLRADPAGQRPAPPILVEPRRDTDELADVPRAPAVGGGALELDEELRRVFLVARALARVPRGADPGAPAEPLDLEPRVLADHPGARVPDRPPEEGLGPRVLVEGGARLLGELRHVDRLDLPAGQEPLELPRLVGVLRDERRLHSLQRTPRTPSIAARSSTSRSSPDPSGTSSSMRRWRPASSSANSTRLRRTRRASTTESTSEMGWSAVRSISRAPPARRKRANAAPPSSQRSGPSPTR